MPLIYDLINVAPQTLRPIDMITGLLNICKDLPSPISIVLIGQPEKVVSHRGLVQVTLRDLAQG